MAGFVDPIRVRVCKGVSPLYEVLGVPKKEGEGS